MSFTSTVTTTRTGRVVSSRVLRQAARRRYFSTHSSDIINRDIVIVGGGPAGLAIASALGSSCFIRKNASITLIEGGDLSKIKSWNPPSESFSNRVSSLTNASYAFLQDIGCWEHVDEARTCAVEQMQVWDGISEARIEFNANEMSSPIGRTGMARLTENLNLQRALLRQLDNIPEVQIMQKTKVTSIEHDTEHHGGWPLIRLDNDQILRARLLIGADGFNSPVRKFANISSFGWSYDTQAIVATLSHMPRGAFEGPNTVAYQRFLPTGPIAFLPLTPTASSLVWSTKPSLATALLACDPRVLYLMINAAFRLPYTSIKYLHERILEAHSLGSPISADQVQEEIQWREKTHGIDRNSAYSSVLVSPNVGIPPADSESVPPIVTEIQAGTMASFPLRFNHAESYIGEGQGARTVLVGDAAHTIHPLAGQGLNLGLADAECLVRCIKNNLLNGGDLGSYTALLPYTQERYLANHTMMSSVDKLHKVYSTELQPIVWARSVGVEVLNELDSIKAGIMMTAGATTKNRQHGEGSSNGWSLAGSAVQTLAATAHAASAARGVLGNALGSAVRSIAARYQ
ncbi:hypothetical protein D9613_006875 [Agrocybe pediades]|uniref:Ubiquinone biosynthesis monooxygenase COQ6, mitochondrial n=1 Tax=Agrocybe pediades TaxID=84607 RepID=A0A8H4QG98_9AGAR|nr:hypothetical protein D9613_006875 [Agrocybe pediades]